VLDGVDRAWLGLARVLVVLTSCTPLPQQVPALVELLLELAEPRSVRLATLAEAVLLLDQSVDPAEDVLVG
jgi:hypothetical protein